MTFDSNGLGPSADVVEGANASDGMFDCRILYVLPIPGDDDEITPFQGFSRGACEVSFLLRAVAALPASVFEFTFPPGLRLKSIFEGSLKYVVLPVNIKHLARLKPTFQQPFWVALSSPVTDSAVHEWVSGCAVKPYHASTGDDGGVGADAYSYARFGAYVRERLRERQLVSSSRRLAEQLLSAFRERPSVSTLKFPRNWHNAVMPSEFVLERLGFQFTGEHRFNPSQGDAQVIQATCQAARTILAQRPEDARWVTPSLILATTGRSRAMEKEVLRRASKKGAPKSVRAIPAALGIFRRQQGYFPRVENAEMLQEPAVMAVAALRTEELHAFSNALMVRAASEASAFVRLPSDDDRVWHGVRKLADCYRGSNARTSKLVRLVADIKAALSAAVPPEFDELLRCPPTTIRIASEIPLEWYCPGGREQLLFRHSCSRLPVAPGNIMFQQALPAPTLHLPVAALRDVLVVRSLKKSDPIHRFLELCIEELKTREGEDVRFTIVDVATREELVAALNNFSGAWLVFDSHGAKTSNASALRIGTTLVDPMDLRGSARVPPIVFPVACDVHPIDTQHSSAAQALLSCGARTVIGSLLPVHAAKAALFFTRLLRAAQVLVPMFLNGGMTKITWSELFSTIRRSHLVHEVNFLLRSEGRNDERLAQMTAETASRVILHEDGWYERFVGDFAEYLCISEAAFRIMLEQKLPLPECALYVQVGDPESISIYANDYADKLAKATRQLFL